jgi:hypothetical protein
MKKKIMRRAAGATPTQTDTRTLSTISPTQTDTTLSFGRPNYVEPLEMSLGLDY